MFATEKLSAAAPLNAEAGKTYYYRVVVDDNRQQPQLWVKAMDEPEGLPNGVEVGAEQLESEEVKEGRIFAS